MEPIFNILTEVTTPLALAGGLAAIFFFLLGKLIDRGIIPVVRRREAREIVVLIIERLFQLSLVGLVLSFVGYVVLIFTPMTSPQELETPQLERPFDNTLFNEYPRNTALRWRSVKKASHYLVEVQYQIPNSGQWHDLPKYPLAVQENNYTFQFPGAQSGRWRVMAVGPGEIKSESSKWWYFTHQR